MEDAKKRLTALERYSELGAGFKIAMRDLEIRGAGNLLGTQQHGYVSAIGFDLYCRLLLQTIEAFKKIKHENSEKIPGIGLGLSVCKGLIDSHGGRIWIESEVGKGSTCWFTLPLDAGNI